MRFATQIEALPVLALIPEDMAPGLVWFVRDGNPRCWDTNGYWIYHDEKDVLYSLCDWELSEIECMSPHLASFTTLEAAMDHCRRVAAGEDMQSAARAARELQNRLTVKDKVEIKRALRLADEATLQRELSLAKWGRNCATLEYTPGKTTELLAEHGVTDHHERAIFYAGFHEGPRKDGTLDPVDIGPSK